MPEVDTRPTSLLRELAGIVAARKLSDRCGKPRLTIARWAVRRTRKLMPSIERRDRRKRGLCARDVEGWTTREQQHVIAYLREENQVLREMLGTRRLRFICACISRLDAWIEQPV